MINFLTLNEIISSTIVYDQDATRSRGFILVKLGAPLQFHYMLYSVFPICGHIFSKKKKKMKDVCSEDLKHDIVVECNANNKHNYSLTSTLILTFK